ncbi:site-specific DNA-methyltransferase, partial [Candidatus Desantisbacteria bacterium]|nr:site-specific DNA-methyltransferase [Candidatus Desantisbacteria bacterium]
KNIIWNHHLSIPYHTLDEVENLHFQPKKADGNLIIEGDNLLALKALLPQYAGKIKCIYIDPPYNTGNEGWVYNDNVNSPMLKEWMGREVGKDDLTRHDKWLCMMVPRLKLLRELLADDGAIFISIDDNEQHILRMVMDEVFGEGNFVADFIWNHRKSSQNDIDVSLSHNYTFCYAKNRELFTLNSLEIDNSKFSNPDNDSRGDWVADPFDAPNIRPNLTYAIVNPNTALEYWPPQGRHWRTTEENFLAALADNRIVWGKTGKSKPQYKRFKSEAEEKGTNTFTIWDDIGTATEATKELMELFAGKKVFDTPKPVSLLKKILKLATHRNSIILDSFSGSGTTMHAVMDLNKEDGGNRKCILIQMSEATIAEPAKNICKDITRERVKRAIEKYGYNSGFQYFKVGIPIDAETLLSGNLPTFNQFAEYVYYLCTGKSPRNKSAINEESYFVGEHSNFVIYLVYKQDFDELTRMALNLSLAENITAMYPKKKIIVYAPACFLEEDYMKEKNIDFVGIPYNLFQRLGV